MRLQRQDLYFRFAVVTLSIAPLRERTVDIALLTSYFINATRRIMNKKVEGASAEVINLFLKHNWPGNVRELQHAVEHAMNYAEDKERLIEMKHIPPHLLQKYGDSKYESGIDNNYPESTGSNDLKGILHKIELDVVRKALNNNNYNITKTARSLGMSRQNLQQRIKRLSITF